MAEGILQIVRQVLNLEDIEGLLSLGAPPDEYDREAQLVGQKVQDFLASRPERPLSGGEVADALRDVWNETFGPFSQEELAKREAAFSRAAAEIIRLVGGTAG